MTTFPVTARYNGDEIEIEFRGWMTREAQGAHDNPLSTYLDFLHEDIEITRVVMRGEEVPWDELTPALCKRLCSWAEGLVWSE